MVNKSENQQVKNNKESYVGQGQKNNFNKKQNKSGSKYRQNRGIYKGSQSKRYSNLSTSRQENRSRINSAETYEDIQNDIVRIEKEIQLEIRQIKSCKLGL